MTISLRVMLQDYDLHLLTVIANRWDVDLQSRQPPEAAAQLAQAMLEPAAAEHEWSRLDNRERAALQILLGSPEKRQTLAEYGRLYGDIRQMGEEKRAREKPHLAPLGMAEQLYYRGFIGLAYDEGPAGMLPFVYVPFDLAERLPIGDGAYLASATATEEDALSPADEEGVRLVHKANTALVDDVTTFLAYLQVQDVQRIGTTLGDADRQALADYLLGLADPARIALLVSLSLELGLCADEESGGFLKPVPAVARAWLDNARSAQMQTLVDAWHRTQLYNELAFVPDITLDNPVWLNDPTLMRKMLRDMLAQDVPQDDWFGVRACIAAIKELEPDFQRPAADYESWYIRDANTEEYLRGFEHWDRIEGAMLEIALVGPMSWLGLVDVGASNHGVVVRLSAFGRAYAIGTPFPSRPDNPVKLDINAQGILSVSRHLSRYDRFQLARFTDWGLPGESYEYHISPESLSRAWDQGIRAEHIRAFIKRASEAEVPPNIQAQLLRWESQQAGEAPFYLQQTMVLHSDSADALDDLYQQPTLRRFLGERLGERAAAVRADQWQDLVAALNDMGIAVEHEA
ncbi:MAG: helicase-associated domain-containing protein [Anaerolineales bacterium]